MATQTYDWQRGAYVSPPGFLRQPSGGQAWPPSPSRSLRVATEWPQDPPPLLPSTPAHQLPPYNSPSQALTYPGAAQTHARSSSSSSSSSALSTPKNSARSMPVLLPGSPTFQHPSHGYDQIWVPPPGTTDEAPRRYMNLKTGKLIPPDQVPPHRKMITAPPPASPKTPHDNPLALTMMVPESPSAGLFPMPLPGEARPPPKALPAPPSAHGSPAAPSLHITPASPRPSPARSYLGSPRSQSRQATPHGSSAPSIRDLSSPSRPQSTPPMASPRASPAPSLRSVSKNLSPTRSHARSPLASPAPSISEMLGSPMPPGSPMSLVGPSPLRAAISPPHSPNNDSDSDASVGGHSVVSLLRSPPRSPTQVPLPTSPSNSSVRSALSPVPVGARSPPPGSVRSPTGSVRSPAGSVRSMASARSAGARSPPPGSVRSAASPPPGSMHSPASSIGARSPPHASMYSPTGSSTRSPLPSVVHSPTGSMRALTPTQGSVAASLRSAAASPAGSVRPLSPPRGNTTPAPRWGSPTGSLMFAPGAADDYTPTRTEVQIPDDMRSIEADLSLLPDVAWHTFPRWAQVSRNESYIRLIASNRDVEDKYQADVAAHRAEGKDIEELTIQRHLKLTRNGEVEERRLLKDLQVRFLLQRPTEEYESWENDFKNNDPKFIVQAIQEIYTGHTD